MAMHMLNILLQKLMYMYGLISAIDSSLHADENTLHNLNLCLLHMIKPQCALIKVSGQKYCYLSDMGSLHFEIPSITLLAR